MVLWRSENTKKGISGLLKRKKKNEEDSEEVEQLKNDSSHVASSSLESEFSQASEEPLEAQNITCPNTKCGKGFEKPLQLIDLAKPSDEGYPVCPYCLSKIESTQPEQEMATETFLEEKPQDIIEHKEEGCPHFVGYLRKRPKNVEIPDFCLTCPEMMKCLLG